MLLALQYATEYVKFMNAVGPSMLSDVLINDLDDEEDEWNVNPLDPPSAQAKNVPHHGHWA